MPRMPDAPQGVLTKHAQTAYSLMAWVVGLVALGVAIGITISNSAEARSAAPAELGRVEQKLEAIDTRVRDLQVQVAGIRGELHPVAAVAR